MSEISQKRCQKISQKRFQKISKDFKRFQEKKEGGERRNPLESCGTGRAGE